MFEMISIFIAVTVAAFIGSINGLGVTFLISIFLVFINRGDYQSHLWLPYLSTTLVAFIFTITRFKILLKNFAPILYLGAFSCAGLILGKVFKENVNLLWPKMLFGLGIIIITYSLNKLNFFSRLNVAILKHHVWSFSSTDNFIIFIIGLIGGMLDFSLAIMLYTYLMFNKEEYNVEHLDVCVYSTLFMTSFVNFLFFAFTKNASIPEYFSFTYVLAIFVGALSARAIYQLISLEWKRGLLIFALYTLGFKLLVINYLYSNT